MENSQQSMLTSILLESGVAIPGKSTWIHVYKFCSCRHVSHSWYPRLQPVHGSKHSHLLILNRLCIPEMFTEHLLCDTHYVMPWDYNGEEQAVVPVPWDTA